jgi:sugar phosphate isomerase/epimerase
MSVRFPLGVVDIAYAKEPDVGTRSELARADGFDHIDVMLDVDPAALVLPIGCPTAFPKPASTWCATPAPPVGDGAWERTVRWWRAAPEALCEPWAGASVHSIETVRALRDEVPGVGFLIDTGHVTAWGGDVLELLPFARHVQLRDARPGEAQVPPGAGTVDFAAIIRRLDELDYAGVLSIEYFDLPEHGWGCADPAARAKALRELLTTLD